jgi:glycosyltransferase involved in cell wall biosynthesis
MMPTLVTVLMPVYNGERFLKEAIGSILHQTFQQFELLIIDDGSTDNSVSIIKEYDDPRIRLIQNETNKGISFTLNLGLRKAKADLIARMDADDISYPERLAKQYAYMQSNPDCMLLNTWAREITEEGKPVRTEKFNSSFYYYNMTFECWTYHSTVLFRKEAALSVGGYPNSHSEDYVLFSNLIRKYKIWNLEEVLLDYRINQASLHTVAKKHEYAEAHAKQVLDNIRYYTGGDYHLPYEIIEALKWNFDPIVQKRSMPMIRELLNQLDFISTKILEKENPNRYIEAIKQAAAYKKNYTITMLARKLPLLKALQLLAITKKWNILFFLVTTNMKRRLGFGKVNGQSTS